MAGKKTHVVTVSLPKELFRELEELRARLFRKRSEIVKEAVRQYVERFVGERQAYGVREAELRYDDEPYTAAQKAAFAAARRRYERGESLTLEEFNRKVGYVARRRRPKRR